LACQIGRATQSREHFATMTEQHADVFEILIGQITQYRDIDAVFSKALRILGQAELFEPVRDLLHHDPYGSPQLIRISGRGR
jgi:hypothetical protein